MDLRMPVMDGYEATRRIKSTPKGHQIAIIALTASAFEDDRERILNIGCDDFVRKPFQQREIFDMLTKHIGVRFVYEEEPAHHRADQQVDTTAVQLDILTRVDPDTLPPDWLDEMREATVLAETNRMLEVIERLGGNHEQLANTLRKLVYDFEYDRILRFINEARESS
jgi:response regulator RpfG family c-di-GMP phosphodiesterase